MTIEQLANEIHALFQRSYAYEARLIGVRDFPPLRRTPQQIREVMTRFRIFRHQGNIAGAIEVDQSSDTWRIDSLVVAPELFRTGIATHLLRDVIDEPAWLKIEVQTAQVNVPAMCLYRKFGFSKTGSWMSDEGISLVRLEKQRA